MYTDDILWDYADGLLDPAEAQALAEAIRHDGDLRQRWEAVAAERQRWLHTPLDKPRASFADGVMAAWATEQRVAWAQQPTTLRDRWMVYGLAGGFSTLILGGLLFIIIGALRSVGADVPETPLAVPTVNLDWLAQIQLPRTLVYGLYAIFAVAAIHLVERWVRYRRLLVAA